MASPLVPYSSGERWKGVNVCEMVLPPSEMRGLVSAQQHRIVVNSGKAVDVEWRVGRVWTRKTYQPGYAGIIPQGHANETRWHTGSSAIIILLESNFTELLLEQENIQLVPQRGIDDQDLTQMAARLMKEVKAPGRSSVMRVDALLLALSIQLVTKYSSRKKALHAPKGRLSARQLNIITDYCHSDLQTDYGLVDLAGKVHMCPRYFSRLFTRTVGETPHQYILKIKMEKAKTLLSQSDRSITDIAYELGFADSSHFTKTFKKWMGVTPIHCRWAK